MPSTRFTICGLERRLTRASKASIKPPPLFARYACPVVKSKVIGGLDKALKARGEFALVEVGYLNYSEPTFAEAAQRCHDEGGATLGNKSEIEIYPNGVVARTRRCRSQPRWG